MLEVKFYSCDQIEECRLQFVVIMASYNGKWIFCRHKSRKTWEIPGGHREQNETIEACALRELREETGTINAEIRPLAVYGVKNGEQETFGMLFRATIKRIAPLDNRYEIAEIVSSDSLPDNLTYPLIQPHLFAYALRKEKYL